MAHGFAKLANGPDAFASILHALGVPAPHLIGVGHDTDRSSRRFSGYPGSFRDSCEPTNDCDSIGGYVYCASALRVQFDQAHGRDSRRCSVRAARF